LPFKYDLICIDIKQYIGSKILIATKGDKEFYIKPQKTPKEKVIEFIEE
jgi:hypothetical protein